MLKQLAQGSTFGNGITPNSSLGDVDALSGTNAYTQIENLISTLLGVLTILGSIVFVVYFFLGAFKWISAGGDAGKIGQARDQMVQGVLGLVVIVAAYAVVGLIGNLVGLDLILQPADALKAINNGQQQQEEQAPATNNTAPGQNTFLL